MEHDKHRERMRQRYLTSGFDNFQSHELLEMLLFYAHPRGNTNPTAHALMERFGSLKNVMEASLDELQEVEGIGEQSAILFKLVTEFTRRYAIEAYQPKGYCFRNMREIAMFIAPKFTGLDHEQLHMMLFNNRMNLLDHCIVSDGVVNSAEAPSRYIAERAYRKKAAFVILAHNHPNGIAKPSPDDLDVTEYIGNALSLLGITLIEHLIIVNFGFYPVLHNQAKNHGLTSPIQSVSQDGGKRLEDLYDAETGVYQFEPLF